MALKTHDRRCIPLCHRHHDQYHHYGRDSFESHYNIDYEYVIRELNRIYDERMEYASSP